ncbi:hypothetical protein AAFA46_08780 [Oscillospiraceae bacterium WX1]
MADEKTLMTPWGVFAGVTSKKVADDGGVLALTLDARNVIVTHAGELIPAYGAESPRRRQGPAVTFHRSGMIKSVMLETQQAVLTPIGEMPAERVTFYETGEVARVFPVDGKLSGFWSESDERAVNIPLHFELGFTAFTAALVSLSFYKSGDIRSVTLFPGETVVVSLPTGAVIPVRYGFSLYESGQLRSVEPAEPTAVDTRIGRLHVFDDSANGINADSGSLIFDEEGNLWAAATQDSITIADSDGKTYVFKPSAIRDLLEEETLTVLPLRLSFDTDGQWVSITPPEGDGGRFNLTDCRFELAAAGISGCPATGCDACSRCAHREG